jgi:hypothetical protein
MGKPPAARRTRIRAYSALYFIMSAAMRQRGIVDSFSKKRRIVSEN